MPTNRKTQTTGHKPPTTMLSQWIFKWPVKFAFISFGLIFAAAMIVALAMLSENSTVVEVAMLLSFTAAFAFIIRWAIKRTNVNLLSRRDLLYVSTGATMIMLAISLPILLFVILAAKGTFISYQGMLLALSPVVYFAIVTLIFIAGLYIVGLVVFNLIAIYKYARANGVPQWKILLTLPLGTDFLGWPAFIADSNKKTADAITNRTRWFERFVGWIMVRPMHGAIVLVAVVFSSGFMDIEGAAVTIISLFALFALAKIYTLKKLTHHMAGMISTIAIVFNIASIALVISGTVRDPAPAQPMAFHAAFEQIEISEVE
ncbi:MAG: hypothetical protein FWE64_02015 [Alphaproteobacteria bacterium]|nr:hypothetical protein [Alphaproteobacteria bacterium]